MKSKRLLNVIPECYVDTNFVEYLLNASVNHQHSCSKVIGQLNTSFADRFAIGIIDKDKVELGYIKECDTVCHTEHLTLLKHKTKSQYLITIAPAIDQFVLDCANEQGVNTMDFGIPSDLKGFTKLSKSVTSNTDKRFKSLFAAIKENHEIEALKNAMLYLNDNQFQSNNKSLIEIFGNNIEKL